MRTTWPGMVIGVGVAVAIAATAVVYRKYDDWFVYPSLRAHVNAQTKNPTASQFRNEVLSGSGWLCGEINAQNGQGGYAGFRRFISHSPREAYIEGIGYVGVPRDAINSVDDYSQQLKKEIQILDDRRKAGISTPMSDERRSEEAAKRIFEERWESACT